MSVLIKGMEMPKDGEWYEINIFPNGEVCRTNWQGDQTLIKGVTAVPVPPHGRLIDADALLSQYKGNLWTAQTDYAEGLRDVANDIKQAPTIIPAEEGE